MPITNDFKSTSQSGQRKDVAKYTYITSLNVTLNVFLFLYICIFNSLLVWKNCEFVSSKEFTFLHWYENIWINLIWPLLRSVWTLPWWLYLCVQISGVWRTCTENWSAFTSKPWCVSKAEPLIPPQWRAVSTSNHTTSCWPGTHPSMRKVVADYHILVFFNLGVQSENSV